MEITAGNLKEVISALAPGLIILAMRQWFVAAPRVDLKDRLFAYAAVSSIYYAVVHPTLIFFQTKVRLDPWMVDALEYVVLPLVVGVVVAFAQDKDWNSWVWRLIGMQPIHPAPTAWDYAFRKKCAGECVLVTLADGSMLAGRYANGSFSSSSPTERDLLLTEVWDHNPDGPWERRETPKSILICGGDIRRVEFY